MIVGRYERYMFGFSRSHGLVDLLAGHDFGLAHLGLEDGIGQSPALIAERDGAFGIFTYDHLRPAESVAAFRGIELVDDLLILESQVLGDDARRLEREDLIQRL